MQWREFSEARMKGLANGRCIISNGYLGKKTSARGHGKGVHSDKFWIYRRLMHKDY